MNFFILLAVFAIGAVHSVKIASSYNIVHHASPHSSARFNPFFSKSPLSHSSFLDSSFGGPSFFSNHFGLSKALSGAPFGIIAKAPAASLCPAAPQTCINSRYRSIDGSCNNMQNPSLGVPNTRYGRLLSPKYGDGISTPSLSVTGQELPNARLISLVVFGEEDIPDPKFTLYNMQWGQIMTHDMSMQAGGTQAKRHATRCCTDDGKLIGRDTAPTTCYPILIPDHDPAHSQTGTECMNFVRTLTDRDQNCRGAPLSGPAEQLTTVTAYLDLSLIYGSTDAVHQQIRLYRGGRMIVENRDGYQWPPSAQNATAACDAQADNEVCYMAGDTRVNQNPGLTILHIVFLREHNRLADALAHLNPQWNDELIFQEARKINVAQYQHISYYEWLPIFLGRENMQKNRLIYKATAGSFVNDYDPSIDPSVINSHATAAFRYFHSQIEGRLDLISEIRSRTGSLRLSDWFNRPSVLEAGNNYDSLTRGLATQPEQLTDINFDPEIKHFLFRNQRPFGRDLRAIDIQRNRDHGLASYNDFRAFCGLSRASSWEGFLDLISPRDVENLQSLYTSVDDVDVTVGASLESHVAGALAGPTFLCILTEQFFRTRVGDRYFFERGDRDVAFTRAQLNEIRKASAARLFCDNGNLIQSMQPKAFWRISNDNQVRPCSEIPEVDLSLWKDLASGDNPFADSFSEHHHHGFGFHGFKK